MTYKSIRFVHNTENHSERRVGLFRKLDSDLIDTKITKKPLKSLGSESDMPALSTTTSINERRIENAKFGPALAMLAFGVGVLIIGPMILLGGIMSKNQKNKSQTESTIPKHL